MNDMKLMKRTPTKNENRMIPDSIFRPRTSRDRGGASFIERWTNAKAAFVGFLLGRGYSSTAISEVLDDGTGSATVRDMARKWGLREPKSGSDQVYLVVPMTVRARSNFHARAQNRGVSDEEMARRLLICATMPDDLYEAIVPENQF